MNPNDNEKVVIHNYRYEGSGFRINVRPGELPSETVARLLKEQPNVDRPATPLLKSQVCLVHAIEDIDCAVTWEQARPCVVQALREIARANGLRFKR